MKCLLFALAAGVTLAAQPVRADAPAVPPVNLPPVHLVHVENPAVPAAPPAQEENPLMPNAGFPASRYEALWTKSPFAVATSEAVEDTSPDYLLFGIANVDGISYASLIDAHNQDHFLISSDKTTRGMMLSSITRTHDDTYAVVQKDGQPITLKLQQQALTPVAANGSLTNAVVMPGIATQQIMTPQITMPGAGLTTPGMGRPFIRIHRPLINLPPRPAQQPEPAPAQPAATPAAPPPPK